VNNREETPLRLLTNGRIIKRWINRRVGCVSSQSGTSLERSAVVIRTESSSFTAKFFIFVIALCLSIPSFASTPGAFLDGNEKGWFWYEKTPAKIAPNLIEKQPNITIPSFPPKTMEEARKSIKILKEKAIMNPTEKNIASYIRLQNWMMGRSQLFARVWKDTLRHNPELDYSIEHPTNAQAIIVQKELRRSQDLSKIRKLSKEWGLFFIFRSNCPYCHKEAPILKRFSSEYNMAIVPISQDGLGLPDFPTPQIDKVSRKFGVQTIPALFLVHPKSQTVIPISSGLISQDDLINRIVLTTDKLERRGRQ